MICDIHTHPDRLHYISVMGFGKAFNTVAANYIFISFSCFRYTVQGKEILRNSITYHLVLFFVWREMMVFISLFISFHMSVRRIAMPLELLY